MPSATVTFHRGAYYSTCKRTGNHCAYATYFRQIDPAVGYFYVAVDRSRRIRLYRVLSALEPWFAVLFPIESIPGVGEIAYRRLESYRVAFGEPFCLRRFFHRGETVGAHDVRQALASGFFRLSPKGKGFVDRQVTDEIFL